MVRLTKQSKTKNKRNKKFKPYRGFRSPVRALIFSMLLANVAAWYLVATHAAEPYQVRYILFCADTCTNNEAELDSYAREIQTWYSGQINKTYQLLPTKTVQAVNPSSYYNSNGTNNTDNAYFNLYDEPGLLEPNVKTIVLYGFRAMSNCGVGSGPLAVVDFAANTSCPRIKSAVLAHELGHTLLSSDNSDHTTDGTLMHAPFACNGVVLGQCNLNQSHKDRLSSSPWFITPADASAPTVSITAPRKGTTVSGVINITANASDNVGVVRVEFYIDRTRLIGTVVAAPHMVTFDTTTVSVGKHSLVAKAFDAAGNNRTSTTVSITVALPPPSNPIPPTSFRANGNQNPGCGQTSPCADAVLWNAPSGPTPQFYRLYVRSPGDHTYSGVTGQAPPSTDPCLSAGTRMVAQVAGNVNTYTGMPCGMQASYLFGNWYTVDYWVTSVYGDGRESLPSNLVNAAALTTYQDPNGCC